MESQTGAGGGNAYLVRSRRETIAATGNNGCERQKDARAGPVKQLEQRLKNESWRFTNSRSDQTQTPARVPFALDARGDMRCWPQLFRRE
jgi:hypothetical protein